MADSLARGGRKRFLANGGGKYGSAATCPRSFFNAAFTRHRRASVRRTQFHLSLGRVAWTNAASGLQRKRHVTLFEAIEKLAQRIIVVGGTLVRRFAFGRIAFSVVAINIVGGGGDFISQERISHDFVG